MKASRREKEARHKCHRGRAGQRLPGGWEWGLAGDRVVHSVSLGADADALKLGSVTTGRVYEYTEPHRTVSL